MSKADDALNTFISGFNCSQAVLSAFSAEYGLDTVMAYRVGAALGGGIGHLGETCGAVTGAVLVIGLHYGMTVNDGSQSNREAYDKVLELAAEFKTRNGTIKCRELLGFDIEDREAFHAAMKKGGLRAPQAVCPKAVKDAAEIVAYLVGAQTSTVQDDKSVVSLGGRSIKVDPDGFIQEQAKWDRAVAEDLARAEGAYPLTEDHWKVIDYIREYYAQLGIAPPIKMVVKKTGVDLKTINKLFPSGPARGACKVAGLPKPTGCV
jgi:tRNA 2-thiouridine synthesizing protein E